MSRGLEDYRQINFGFAEAKLEFEKAPRLLRDGYYDLNDAEHKILSSHEFLILGYKGSGKSYVGARLRLLAQDSPAKYLVPQPIYVPDLPLDNFRGIVPDTFDALSRYKQSWKLLLLTEIVVNAADDGGAHSRSLTVMREAKKLLGDAGITARSPASLRKLKTTKVVSTVHLPKFYDLTRELEPNTHENYITIWTAYLEAVCQQFMSQRAHYYFIDGLDDLTVLGQGREALLAGLIEAAADINDLFASDGAPQVKLAVACRTDLYRKLATRRTGKIRRDYGLELNWFQARREPSTAHVIRLANLRARLAGLSNGDVFRKFFPTKIQGQSTSERLLDQTRHTPRDLLQLLKIIQKQVDSTGPISEAQVLSGIADYSDTYMRDDVDEVLGAYFSEPVIRQRCTDLLGTVRRREFEFSQLRDRAASEPRFKGVNVDTLVDALFENGFIGNVTAGGARGTGGDYYRFKYRNPSATLLTEEKLVFNYGLWKTFNVA